MTSQEPRPLKRFGQNFLLDPNAIKKIVSFIPRELDTQCVIEIGTGTGNLTLALSERFEKVITIEIDKRLIEWHKKEGILPKNCHLVEGDVLKMSFRELLKDFHCNEAVLTGNLPYNISSPVVFKMCEERSLIPFSLLMFQREVAERIVAGPGTKDYGILSVICQFCYDVRLLMTLSPSLFRPRPKVFSGVVSFKRKDTSDASIDFGLFVRTVKAAFSKRRKKIKNSLSVLIRDKGDLTNILKDSGIDPNMRPEELEVERFIELTKRIQREYF